LGVGWTTMKGSTVGTSRISSASFKAQLEKLQASNPVISPGFITGGFSFMRITIQPEQPVTPEGQRVLNRVVGILMNHGWERLLLHYTDGSVMLSNEHFSRPEPNCGCERGCGLGKDGP
jgi:hypothetical protein